MTFEDFTTRCLEEYIAKNPEASEKASGISEKSTSVIGAISIVLGITASFFIKFFDIYIIDLIICLLLSAIVVGSILTPFLKPDPNKVFKFPLSVVEKARIDKSYENYPIDYPYSILYPGEPYPFVIEDTEELENSENTALPAPVVSEPEKTEAPAPESVVITCEKCGQKMLIPSGSGAVKVTCPKCGSDIIHTYSN